MCVTWLIHMCDVTHSYVWRDSFICVTWLIHMCVTCLIQMCDVTHSYVWRVSFICVMWLIHMCDVSHPYVWRDSFICVTWLIHMCACKMKRTMKSAWRREPDQKSRPATCVTWLIHICDMTHSCVWHESYCARDMTYMKTGARPEVKTCHMFGVTHLYVWHVAFIHVTGLMWLIHTCDMNHIARVTWLETYMALLETYMALLETYMALLETYMALLWIYIGLLCAHYLYEDGRQTRNMSRHTCRMSRRPDTHVNKSCHTCSMGSLQLVGLINL